MLYYLLLFQFAILTYSYKNSTYFYKNKLLEYKNNTIKSLKLNSNNPISDLFSSTFFIACIFLVIIILIGLLKCYKKRKLKKTKFSKIDLDDLLNAPSDIDYDGDTEFDINSPKIKKTSPINIKDKNNSSNNISIYDNNFFYKSESI